MVSNGSNIYIYIYNYERFNPSHPSHRHHLWSGHSELQTKLIHFKYVNSPGRFLSPWHFHWPGSSFAPFASIRAEYQPCDPQVQHLRAMAIHLLLRHSPTETKEIHQTEGGRQATRHGLGKCIVRWWQVKQGAPICDTLIHTLRVYIYIYIYVYVHIYICILLYCM